MVEAEPAFFLIFRSLPGQAPVGYKFGLGGVFQVIDVRCWPLQPGWVPDR